MKKNSQLASIKSINVPGASSDVLGSPLIDMHWPESIELGSSYRDFCDSLVAHDEQKFLDVLSKQSKLQSFLSIVFGCSPYLLNLAVKFPSIVVSCSENGFSSALNTALTPINLDDEDLLDEAFVMRHLRMSKQKAALICGLADLGGWWPAQQVSKGMSDTADFSLRTTVQHLLLNAHKSGKIELVNSLDPEVGSGFAVLAMGKHGAAELNYSSDIDLIVFVDPDAPSVLNRDESVVLFGRMTRTLVKIMQSLTEDGYVFRTDLRLRPDPGSMPIAVPVELAMHYYEARGQNWERAALIKARVVAGDRECGDRILSDLKPFIWRRYLDYAAIADVHSIKRQIQSHKGYTALEVAGHNVKLGRGGIREIEFFVQTQQLIAGGRMPELRGRRTLEMLAALADKGWVTADASRELADSYLFLRDIEHRLQMINDAQTHVIPEEIHDLQIVSCLCGFETVGAFKTATLAHLVRVEHHYADLFAREPELTGKLGNLSFTGDDDDPGTLETLAQLGFMRPSDIISVVRGWHFGRHKAMQTADARERLTELTPTLLECFSDTGNPDQAAIAFDAFLKGLPAGFQLFNLLKANPHLLHLLVMVLGVAPKLAATITRRPHVFDGLLEPDFFNTELTAEIFTDRLMRSLDSARDYEDGLDRARQFAAEQKFLIGIRVLSGSLPALSAGKCYAVLAECMLHVMLGYVRTEFEKQHGQIMGAGLAVLGMGNLGTRELTAGSDIDLVVLYEYDETHDTSDGARPLHASQYFGRLTQRLIAAMSAPTAEGVIYELDFRLRPSGNSGPLAASLRSFQRYHEEESWTWERLALTRARAVTGDQSLLLKCQTVIDDLFQRWAMTDKDADDVLKMRYHMDKERPPQSEWDIKLAQGGLVDLEFIAQWAVLSGLVENRHSTRQLLEFMTPPVGHATSELLEAFDLFTNIIQISRICLTEVYQPQNAPSGLTERLMHEIDFPNVTHAEEHLRVKCKDVRDALQKLLTLEVADTGTGSG